MGPSRRSIAPSLASRAPSAFDTEPLTELQPDRPLGATIEREGLRLLRRVVDDGVERLVDGLRAVGAALEDEART
jgi:hypothetical protein